MVYHSNLYSYIATYQKFQLQMSSYFTQGMKIAHLNIRGLTSKIDEVKKILHKNDLDIFCLSETFLNESKSNSFFHILNYNIVRQERNTGQGGGLLCYIRVGISFEEVNVANHSMPESITLKISQTHSQSFLTCFVYRPPSTLVDWNHVFTHYIENIVSICREVIILGDFNVDLGHNSTLVRWFRNVINPLGLTQLIKDFTRIAENSESIIDHIYTNHPANVRSSLVLK